MEIRPLTEADVEAAAWVQVRSIGAIIATPERPYVEPTNIDRNLARVRHCLTHDPDGAWVSVDDAGISGVALSIRRGPLWFLSLLAVRGDVQARGIGRPLLAAAHRTSADASMGFILASQDPKALRLYHSLGLTLEPAYACGGPLERSLLPSDLGVREGDWSADLDLVEELTVAQRGAPRGVDLPYWASMALQLFVAEDGPRRGFAVGANGRLVTLAATTDALAARLLTAVAATAPKEDGRCDVPWISARTPWAVEVAMTLRLPLALDGSLCTSRGLGPMTTYLPSGVLG